MVLIAGRIYSDCMIETVMVLIPISLVDDFYLNENWH